MIVSLNDVNRSQHNVTMNTPLVDPEGFPRADIDVYAIRHARVALNRLRNDHRDVVDRLGRVLEQVYAVGSTPSAEEGDKGKMVNGDGPSRVEVPVVREQPLARVNLVSDASPAATAVSRKNSTRLWIQIPSILTSAAHMIGPGTKRPDHPIRHFDSIREPRLDGYRAASAAIGTGE